MSEEGAAPAPEDDVLHDSRDEDEVSDEEDHPSDEDPPPDRGRSDDDDYVPYGAGEARGSDDDETDSPGGPGPGSPGGAASSTAPFDADYSQLANHLYWRPLWVRSIDYANIEYKSEEYQVPTSGSSK